MLKKLLFVLSFCVAGSAWAQQIVPVYWPFSIAGQSAMMAKSLADSANRRQTKYRFIFTHRPGAGGAVAALSTLGDKDLAILVSSSSFYIRPLLFNESHEVEKFNMINTICVNQPLALFSKNISNINEARGRKITSGIAPGSITQLVNEAIRANNPDINIVDIAYKGTPEATSDMLGGHIDGSVDFTGKLTFARFPAGVNVLGITGTKNFPNMTTFASQKIKGLENVVASFYVFVPNTVSREQQQELSKILYDAFDEHVRDKCEEDYGTIQKTPFDQLERLHQSTYQFWRTTTKTIKKQ